MTNKEKILKYLDVLKILDFELGKKYDILINKPFDVTNLNVKSSTEFVLPEKWCIKVTESNKSFLQKYNYLNKIIGYDYSINGYYGNKSDGDIEIPFGAVEITFEQFKKYVVKDPTENIAMNITKNYTAEEALAELKRRGFEKGCQWIYMYRDGTYDESDVRTAITEPRISNNGFYIDCGGGYLWHSENPSHLHKGPISSPTEIKQYPLIEDNSSMYVWKIPTLKKTKDFLNPVSLLPKVKILPINKQSIN